MPKALNVCYTGRARNKSCLIMYYKNEFEKEFTPAMGILLNSAFWLGIYSIYCLFLAIVVLIVYCFKKAPLCNDCS